jgi:hypothetical protein
MQRISILVLAGVCVIGGMMVGCGGSQPAADAPDRAAPGTERSTPSTTCRWIPALPEDREDPCTHMQQGAKLEITERADMRAESVSQQSHTCICD